MMISTGNPFSSSYGTGQVCTFFLKAQVCFFYITGSSMSSNPMIDFDGDSVDDRKRTFFGSLDNPRWMIKVSQNFDSRSFNSYRISFHPVFILKAEQFGYEKFSC